MARTGAADVRRGRPLLVALVAAVLVSTTGCGSDGPADAEAAAYDDCANATAGPASVVGFDPATGEERWHRLAGDRTFGFAVDGVLVAQGASGAVGYDVTSGRALWCLPSIGAARPGTNTDRPMVVDELFVRTGDGVAEGIDARDGEVRWSTPVPWKQGEDIAMIAVHGDEVVVLGSPTPSDWPHPPEMSHQVLARLDGRTGAPVDGPPDQAWLTQEDGSTTLVMLDDFATVVVSEPDGTERWRHSTSLTTSVDLDGDVVLWSSAGGPGTTVRALSAADGSEVWAAYELRGIRMVATGQTVYVGGQETLTALDRATGERRFEATFDTYGRGGGYSEPGYFSALAQAPDGSGAAGLMVASQPHRD